MSISKFKTSISLYTDIEDFLISTNDPSISVYDIEVFSLRYRISCSSSNRRFRCFLSDPAWAAYSHLDTDLRCAHCIMIANQSLPVAHAPPGPPSAAAAEAALGGAAAPAAPGAAPTAAAGAGLGRRSGGRTAAAAGAGINGTQERVILGDKN
jgi:hypothetical protein